MAKIAIVDNNIEACEVLGRLLQHAGHDVDCIVGSRHALAVLRRMPPDLLVLDVNMPEMNGLELLDILRHDPMFNYLPVVMVSGVANAETQVQAYELGARDYIIKGSDWRGMVARIQGQLSSHAN